MHKRTIQSRLPKRANVQKGNANAPLNQLRIATLKYASEGNPVSTSATPEKKKKRGSSPDSDHEQTEQSRPQPAAKRLKLDDENNSEAETSSESSTSESSNDDDTSTSSSEGDDASTPPPSYFPCGYLHSATNKSHVIHLKMNRFGGRRQTFTVGYDNSCNLHVEGWQVEPHHCVIRLKVRVNKDGTVSRRVLARGLKSVKGAQTTIKSRTGSFLLEAKSAELSDGDLIRFGKGSWFRCRKPEFHQLYCEVEQVHGGTGANSTVVRVRRGHDGVECIAKAITADHDGMAVTELLAYEALGRHSNIVRLLESFFNKNSKIHHLVLEPATTDLSRFVRRMRAHNQADLRVAASVWTKQITSAVHYLHSLGMSHRDMKPKNILVFLTGAGEIEVKLADFGLVRLKSQPVESNCSAGTPGWMAPAAFRQYHDDHLIDCYGVGRILFFILTHREWPSEASAPENLCGCAHGCPEACVRRECEFRHIKKSGANAGCVDFLRKVLVGSPDMCLDSEEMVGHSYVSYVPSESEQARIDSAVARLYTQFNRLSRET